MNENANELDDFDELDQKLQEQLDDQLNDLENIKLDREKIGNPDSLGQVVMDVVWEQFINQVGSVAGEDFIKENRGLRLNLSDDAHIVTIQNYGKEGVGSHNTIIHTKEFIEKNNGQTLDLSDDAHIQTTENFEQGKIATHNHKIDYQQRHDDWQSNFRHENGNVITHETRSGKEEATLVEGARDPFDKDRPTGSAGKGTDMDHTVSAGEIIRDPAANAHLTKEEQIKFANSEANLNEMDSSQNRSKGDKSMTDWLDNPNKNGQKPDEIFDISEEQDRQYREKDNEARAEYEKVKNEGEQRSIETGKESQKEEEARSIEAGKESQKEEAKRIGGSALRAILMGLLAGVAKKIIQNLIKWFKSGKKNFDTFMASVKEAFINFVKDLKENVFTTLKTGITTIATAIFGPIVGLINKVFILLKQGYKSIKEAINYLKNPTNKGKSLSIIMMEVSKILIAGLTAGGAIVLGEVIEKALLSVPGFQVPIPILGTPASIIGLFAGAVVSGIIGAIALNLIDKAIAKKQLKENTEQHIDKANQILATQYQLLNVKEAKVEQKREEISNSIKERHTEAGQFINNSFKNVMDNYDTIDRNTENIKQFDANVSDNTDSINENAKKSEALNNEIENNNESNAINQQAVESATICNQKNTDIINDITSQIERNNISNIDSQSHDEDIKSMFNSLNKLKL